MVVLALADLRLDLAGAEVNGEHPAFARAGAEQHAGAVVHAEAESCVRAELDGGADLQGTRIQVSIGTELGPQIGAQKGPLL